MEAFLVAIVDLIAPIIPIPEIKSKLLRRRVPFSIFLLVVVGLIAVTVIYIAATW